MAISGSYISERKFEDKTQIGNFTTDGAGSVSNTTNGSTPANSVTMNLTSSAAFNDAGVVTVPTAGAAAATAYLLFCGNQVLSSNQLSMYNPGIQSAVASGTTVTQWDRVQYSGRPTRIRITRRDNGDWYEWVEGMEPYSIKQSIAGVFSVNTLGALVTVDAIHFAPGLLAASVTYDIEITY